MKLGALIKKLLEKAGVDTTTEDLKLAIEADIEVPDAAANTTDRALMTADAAVSNSKVIGTLRKQILTGIDAEIDAVIGELSITPDADWPNEQNTFKKVPKLAKMAQEAGKKAAGAGNKEGAKEWAEKDADYNRQLRELKAEKAKLEAEKVASEKTGKINTRLERRLLAKAKELNLPDEMDIDLKLNIVTGAIGGDLLKKGLRWELDANDNLIVVDKEGNPAHNPADNVPYEANNLIDGALAQNKLLKINGTGEGHQQQQQQQFTTGPIPGDPNAVKRQQAAQAAADFYTTG